jgi:hypothetical protein
MLSSFAYGQSSVDSSLIALWHFDGNTNDSSVYSNHGVAFGVPEYVPGISGQALLFDGQDDYVLVPGTLSLHNLTKEYTFAGWIKPLSLPNFYVPIVTKGNTTDMRTPLAVLYRSEETTPYIRIVGDGLPFDLVNIESVKDACPLNEWTFFTWTYKFGKVSVYKNAEWIAAHQFNFIVLEQNFLPMDIGRDAPGFSTEWLHGILDEMCIFNRALDSSEIRTLYQSKIVSSTNESAALSQAFLKVYPNPAAQNVTIEYSFEKSGEVEIEVFNTSGQLVVANSVESLAGSRSTINVGNLPDGVYRVCLNNGYEHMVKNFVVLKN